MLEPKDGVQFDSQSCVGIIDLVPLTGCFFKGFKKLKNLNVPLRYFAVLDPKHYDWFLEHLMDNLTADILENSFEVPGFVIPDVKPPQSHMEEKPSPQL